MSKLCTSLEQSKKLIELGIDVNTADMCWSIDMPDLPTLLAYPITDCDNWENKFPAWSISALLKLIKSEIYGETIYGDTITYKVDFRKYKFTNDVELYQIAYCSIKFDVDGHYSFKDMINTGEKEDPIDAEFEMVVWLKENGNI